MPIKIIGTGSYLPDNIVDNNFLSSIVDTSDDWITSRTGIKERRISMGESTSILAAEAANNAILDANIEAKNIDYIIVATMSADYFLPNTASEVQYLIGAVNATCIDLNAACTGFVYAFNTAAAYIEAGFAKTVLIIGAETISKQINWKDRSTCVLFGDGAGAVVVNKSNYGEVIHMVTGCDGSKKEALTCKVRALSNPFSKQKDNDNYITMDGHEIYKFAITKVPESILSLVEKTNVDIKHIKYFILHQANKRIIDLVAKKLNISSDKFPANVEKYGNTSAASIPILLDELNKCNELTSGDKIIISGFGGGLTWGSTLFEW